MRKNDFVFTNDGIGSGVVIKRTGNIVYVDNNVNVNKYKVSECEKI